MGTGKIEMGDGKMEFKPACRQTGSRVSSRL